MAIDELYLQGQEGDTTTDTPTDAPSEGEATPSEGEATPSEEAAPSGGEGKGDSN